MGRDFSLLFPSVSPNERRGMKKLTEITKTAYNESDRQEGDAIKQVTDYEFKLEP